MQLDATSTCLADATGGELLNDIALWTWTSMCQRRTVNVKMASSKYQDLKMIVGCSGHKPPVGRTNTSMSMWALGNRAWV